MDKNMKEKIIKIIICVPCVLLAISFLLAGQILGTIIFGVIAIIPFFIDISSIPLKLSQKIKNKNNSLISINIICFLIPLVGFIGYVTHIKNDYPLAKKCLNSALCGFAIYIIAIIIMIYNNM